MKKLIKFACLCLTVSMQSCSSEDAPEYMGVNDQDAANSKMVVRFDGKIYKTDVKEEGDSVSYLNKEYDELYHSKIATSPNIAAVLSSDEYGTTYVVTSLLRKNFWNITISCNQKMNTNRMKQPEAELST